MSVDLLIVRHAIAFERDASRWPDDRKRPLTRKGSRKFEKAAKGLRRALPTVERVISSPLIRAQETAAILTDISGWPKAEESAALSPGGAPEDVLALIRGKRTATVAVVGHEPDLSKLAAACLTGSGTAPAFEFRKGGVCHIRFESAVKPGQGQLIAFLSPRLLRRMR